MALWLERLGCVVADCQVAVDCSPYKALHGAALAGDKTGRESPGIVDTRVSWSTAM